MPWWRPLRRTPSCTAVSEFDRPDDIALKAGVSILPINGEDRFSLTRDFMTMRSVGVMQEFTRGDKRKARWSVSWCCPWTAERDQMMSRK